MLLAKALQYRQNLAAQQNPLLAVHTNQSASLFPNREVAQFKGSAGNWPFGAAASMILLTLVLIALMFYTRQQNKLEDA